MRRIFSIIFLVVLAISLTACATYEDKKVPAPAYPHTDKGENIHDDTAELKMTAYNNFKGKTEYDLVSDGKVDFEKFFQLAGLDYYVVDDHAIVTESRKYNDAESFAIIIHVDPETDIITDDVTYVGRIGESDWGSIIRHESATDFIFDAKLGERDYRIGCDELDYLWRKVRVLTAPVEKIDEVNSTIDDEIKSYSNNPEQ